MFSWRQITRTLQRLRFSHRPQLNFLEDLTSLVNEGVVVTQAVDTIAKVSTDITQVVAKDISYAIASGKGLADGMQDWFPRAVFEVVRAGEESGTLLDTLRAANSSFKKRSHAAKEIIQNLTYPLMVLLLAMIVTVFVKIQVLTTFLQLQPIDRWPPLGQYLYHLGYLLQTWWWFYLTFLLLLMIIVVMVLRNVTGDLRNYIDKVPLLSLYRNSVAARFMETLGLLIANGVVLKKALDIMHRDAAPYLAWHLLLMEYRLSGGKDNIAEVLDTQLICVGDLIRLRVMSQGKGFEQALLRLGRQANQATFSRISRISRITGAFLLIVTALLTMFIVSGIYSISSMLAMP